MLQARKDVSVLEARGRRPGQVSQYARAHLTCTVLSFYALQTPAAALKTLTALRHHQALHLRACTRLLQFLWPQYSIALVSFLQTQLLPRYSHGQPPIHTAASGPG